MSEAEGQTRSLPFTYERSDFAALSRLAQPRIVRWLFRLAWVLIVLAVLLSLLAALLGDPVQTRWVIATAGLTALAVALQRLGPELGAAVQILVHRRSALLREQQMAVSPRHSAPFLRAALLNSGGQPSHVCTATVSGCSFS